MKRLQWGEGKKRAMTSQDCLDLKKRKGIFPCKYEEPLVPGTFV